MATHGVGLGPPRLRVEQRFAQNSVGPTTIKEQRNKGFLVSIKGDVYTVQDFSGRFVQVCVDENMEVVRFVVSGERVEMQLPPDHRAIAMKPSQKDECITSDTVCSSA